MKYRRYPAYKDSGVAWLGEVPAHWETPLLKYVVRLKYGDSLAADTRDESGTISVFGSNGEVGFHSVANTRAPVIIIGRKGSYGKVTFSTEAAFSIDTTYFVDSTCTVHHLRWLYYALQSVGLDTNSQDTGVPGLSREAAYSSRFILPPVDEQTAIAAFLDRETAKIDALLARQERLIALLQEKRQALISHVVTKGLNPHAAMKESGIEWVGKIPAHWKVSSVRRHFQVDLGKMLNSANQDGSGTTKPYLRAANIHWDRLKLDDVNEMEFSYTQLGHYKLQAGDLLVTEGGVTVGRSALWNNELAECYYQNSLNRVRALDGSPLCTRYLLYWINFTTACGFVDLVADKATFGHLTNEKLKAFPLIATCDKEEVAAIVAFLDCETVKMDNLIAETRRTVSLAKERRAALISAAVTGAIDVRC